MTAYDQLISRDTSNDPLVPDPVSAEIIQELPTKSAILSRARSIPLASKTQRMPVLDVLPTAYFVGTGLDTGLKQTTSQDWANVNLVVEEVAAIVPIPESYLDDAQVPIWDEVRPRMTEAIGKLIDGACLFGASKPSTWSTSIYDAALAASNYTVLGGGADFGVDVADLGEKLADEGFNVDGFASRPGLSWKLQGIRSAQGVPIYNPNLQDSGPSGNLYGYPLSEVKNGSWDASKAQLIAGEWDKAIVGLRSDISFKLFTEGVISDASGAVVLNLMQQDAVALRVTMRLAFATANPVTALQANDADRYPFGFVATTDPNAS